MTGHPVPRVDISNLPIGDELGTGGQGRVVTIGGFLVNGQWPTALKIYSAEAAAELDAAALESIVEFPRQLSPEDARWLQENTAWPTVLVEDAGAACGFLMRVIPEEYYFQFHTQTQGIRQKPADVAFLLNSDQYVSSSGITVSEHDRLSLLAALATALDRLHDLDIFVGDLSPKNLLFSLRPPRPGCFILDCDAMRVRGQTVLKQLHTPDWEVPDGEPGATAAADAYKFGLLAIRLFARDQSSRDRGPLAAVSPELGHLAELSQHSDPAQRPLPAAWIAPLLAAVHDASTAPAAASPPVPAAEQAPASAPGRIAVPVDTVTPAAVPESELPQPSAPGPTAPGPQRPVVTAAPPRRRGALIAWGVAGLVVLGGGAGIAVHALDHSPGSSYTPTSNEQGNATLLPDSGQQNQPTSAPPTPTPSPTTSVGQVTIAGPLISNPQAADIAALFNTYFSGIDEQNYQQALSVFANNAPLNPTSASTLNSLSQADSTSTDSDVVLTSLYPSDGSTVTKAHITFQSNQSPGYGPATAPDQTCTNWSLTYTLSYSSGNYQLFKDKGAYAGC
jgi:eukaryotic-like serine/threonine-protein kinase